jgi:hypothetical protein
MGVGIGGGSTEVRVNSLSINSEDIRAGKIGSCFGNRTDPLACPYAPCGIHRSGPAKHDFKMAGVHCFLRRIFMSERAEIVTI